MRYPYRTLLVVPAALALGFAPVPPPRTGVAEAVVNPFGGGAAGVRRTLLAAVPQALQSGRVAKLNCLKGEKNPAEWVGQRLRAEAVSPGAVRVRLDGCRPNEALALLTALVGAYESGRGSARMAEMELLAAVRLQGQGGQVAFAVLDVDGSVNRRGGQTVLQRPRIVSTGRGQ